MNPIDSALVSICIPIDSTPEPLDSAPSPEALTIEHERHRLLDTLFCELFGYRDAQILHALYLDDLTADETASAWRITPNQVDYIRRKALKTLRTNTQIRALLSPTATI